MYEITLITTEGCLGCEIMENNTKIAIDSANVDIILTVKDIATVDKKFKNIHNLKDFPTIMFFKDNRFVYKYVGSMPSIVVTRWIDIYFRP